MHTQLEAAVDLAFNQAPVHVLRATFILLPVLLGCGIALWFLIGDPADRAAACAGLALVGGMSMSGRSALAKAVALVALASGTGLALAQVRSDRVAAPRLVEADVFNVQGVIVDHQDMGEGQQRLLVAVNRMMPEPPQGMPVRIRVTSRIAASLLMPGSPVRLRARLGPPPGPAMPGGYDFARRAWFEQIGATGFLLRAPRPGETSKGERAMALDSWRARIARRIRHALPGGEGAVAAALLVGDRAGIPETWVASARASGIAHILSISGLHLALVTTMVMGTARLVMALAPPLALRMSIKAVAAFLAGIAAVGYTLLSGASPPAVRSCLVCLVVLLALIVGRDPFSIRTLAFAALVVLLFKAEALIDVSTQMSFAAVGGLIALTSSGWAQRNLHRQAHDGWMQRLTRPVLATLAASLVCEAVLAPIALHHFGQTGLYGLIANLVAIPLTTFIIMPAGIVALLAMGAGLEALPLDVMAAAIRGMMLVSDTVAGLPHAVLRAPDLSLPAFGMAAVATVWLIATDGRKRWCALPVMALAVASAWMTPKPLLWVAAGGRQVAISLPGEGMAGDRLAVADARGGRFVRERWLEAMGADPHALVTPSGASDSQALPSPWQCDRHGCEARIVTQGAALNIAYLRSPAGLPRCADAALVVARFAVLGRCSPGALVLDAESLASRGGVLVWAIPDGERGTVPLRLRDVETGRGRFPWSALPQ